MRFDPQRKNYPIVKVGETYYIDEEETLSLTELTKLNKKNEILKQENEKLEKRLDGILKHLDSIEGVDLIYENKRLQDRVKELENACCEEAVKKNLALNAYEMTRKKLAEIFIEPTFLNDIYHRDYKKEKDEFIFTLKMPWEKAKTIFDKKRIKAILEYEKAEGRKDE